VAPKNESAKTNGTKYNWHWLKKGKNEIEVLELLKPEQSELKGIEKPVPDRINSSFVNKSFVVS